MGEIKKDENAIFTLENISDILVHPRGTRRFVDMIVDDFIIFEDYPKTSKFLKGVSTAADVGKYIVYAGALSGVAYEFLSA